MVDPYHAGAEAMRAAIMRAILNKAYEFEKHPHISMHQTGAGLRHAHLIAKHASIPTSPKKD